MIQRILSIIIAVASFSLILPSCGPTATGSVDDDLREAEAATAVGDMATAENIAAHIIGSENLDKLPATELARLSIVYMQIADSTDREASIAQAADLYRQAFAANADSAAAFYTDVNPDIYPYVAMLKTLVGHIGHHYSPESDSLSEAAGDLPLPNTTDSL